MLNKILIRNSFISVAALLSACQLLPIAQNNNQFPPVPPPPPTAAPGQSGLIGTQLAWEWQEDARPSALTVGEDYLGVIVSDGRFLWLEPDSGLAIGGGFLWPDEIRGESWGSISIENNIALIVAIETYQDQQGDFPATRARVLTLDLQGNELWSLPQLGDKHLYSATTGQGKALVGTNRGFTDNSLSSYNLADGDTLWRFEADDFGFDQLLVDEQRVYTSLIGIDRGGIAAHDLSTGALLWAERDPAILQADSVLLDNDQLYVLTQPAAVALNPDDGSIIWQADFGLAPEAGMAAFNLFLYVVLAPSPQLGSQPGLLGIQSNDGQLAWHALAGLTADPLAADGEVLWAVVKDFNSNTAALSVMDALTGLERARIPIGDNTDVRYQLVTNGDIVYVLGNSLRAYRIPR